MRSPRRTTSSGTDGCDDGSTSECVNATVFIQISPSSINVTLNIVFLGSSAGSVVSTPAGFNCSTASCGTVSFGTSVPINLATIADPGSVFAGWGASADADCIDGSLTPDGDKNCTATFDEFTPPSGQPVTIAVTNAGNGLVISDPPGIDCDGPSADCSEIFQNQRVILIAQSDAGFSFEGFSGDADCDDGDLDGTASVTCIATFEPLPAVLRTLTVVIDPAGTGSGLVAANQGLINCEPDCAAQYGDGETVVLNARPDPGSVFTGWSGMCGTVSGFKATIVLGADATCTATFDLEGQ